MNVIATIEDLLEVAAGMTRDSEPKIKLDKDFYVFTGSTVGVVPIKGKGEYLGKIQNLGSVKTNII